MTTRLGMPCGYAFRVGTRYLIFADRSRDDGRLYMSCDLVRLSDQSAGMLRYLESLSAPDAGGHVWGRVVLPSASRGAAPMASMRVTISGPREMEVLTDATGEFEFAGLPPGSYSVGVTVPPNRPELLSFPQREIRLEGAYACDEVLLWPRFQSRIEGHIVDQAGVPIAGVDVTLTNANENSRGWQGITSTTTDDLGHYDFDGLPEGPYTIRVRAEPDRNGLAPLTAEPVETQSTRQAALASGGLVMLEPVRLQRLVRVSLEGRVVDADGAGLGGVLLWVVALDDRSRWARRFVTDDEGRFSVPVYSGRRQQILVGNRQQPSADVTIVAGKEPVTITVPRP